jgi:hypothetical protein
MRIFPRDQSRRFPRFLEQLKATPVMPYDIQKLKEKSASIPVNLPSPEMGASLLLDYRIFPPSIMSYLTQWSSENREMQPGDVIVQQICLPPFPRFSLKIVTGVRIREIIRETQRIGFSYETLEGHAERGISTFTIEKGKDGMLFRIHTFSEAPGAFARLMAPFFASPYQDYCTRKALQNVQQQLA